MKTPVVYIHDYSARRAAPLTRPAGGRILRLVPPLSAKAQEKAAVQVAENEGMPPERG